MNHAAQPLYESTLPLRDARRRYFEHNGFGPDGGYSARWVRLKLGPFPIAFPNTQTRVRAVRYHDLHHIVTGYATDLTGEAEISAWELASGCRGYIAAWVLNLSMLGIGLVRTPSAVWHAFVRGRHSRNLYGRPYDDTLFATGVGAVRTELGLDQLAPTATASDQAVFVGFASFGVMMLLLQAAVVLAPIAALVAWLL